MEVKTNIDTKCAKNIDKKIKISTEKFEWGNIDVLDIVPKKCKDSKPVFFAPGWSITINSIQDTLSYLADCERRVISLNHKRVGGEDCNSEERRKAKSILAILNRKEIEKIDAVGYSEGCANVLLAANINPDKFRNIVLINPSGLTGNESKWDLVKGFMLDLWDVKKGDDGGSKCCGVFKETIKYVVANPVRSYKEVDEVSKTDLIKLIKKLNKTNIKISIIHNVNDQTFDFEEVQKTLQKVGGQIYIDEFYAVSGRHFDIIKHPQKNMNLVAHALDKFEENGEQ